MVLLTNPQTADLQQRIQNSNFGSPDYLQGFTGTMPGYQQNLLANNFQPGLITRDFSGGATSMNPSGVPNYLSYTPGVPPQAINNNTMLPIGPMVNAAIGQGEGGRGRGPMGDGSIGGGIHTEFIGDRAFRFAEDGTFTELDPESMDYQFNKMMNSLLDNTPVNTGLKALGLNNRNAIDQYNTIKNKYGEKAALEFDNKINYGAFQRSNPTEANFDNRREGAMREARATNTSEAQKKVAAGYAGVSRDTYERQKNQRKGQGMTGATNTGSKGAGGASGRQKGGGSNRGGQDGTGGKDSKQYGGKVSKSGDHRSGMGGGW
tara:strand:- start:1787 stop:2743 length:957 start_codon:yes stop_codon:yes gene_type:complete